MTATRIADIDWTTWTAVDPATLIFVIRAGRILLIHKKRGLGAGKVNGPGGRLEPGETPEQAALREINEELGVTAVGPTWMGEHRFQFVDGYSTHVHVFRASEMHGTPVETDEAIPLWADLDAIPYEQMWEDDRLWLPHLVAGRRFSGYWIFDGDRMLDHRLDVEP